jgi:hypothetical protein
VPARRQQISCKRAFDEVLVKDRTVPCQAKGLKEVPDLEGQRLKVTPQEKGVPDAADDETIGRTREIILHLVVPPFERRALGLQAGLTDANLVGKSGPGMGWEEGHQGRRE